MGLSRRAILPLVAGRALAQRLVEWARYSDPATEFEVLRLTSPERESRLPVPPARAVDRRSRTLLYAASTGGSFEAFQLEFANGQIRKLGMQKALDPESLTLSADDHSALYFDGPELVSLHMQGLRPQVLYRAREGWIRSGGLVSTEDGQSLFFVEAKGGITALRRLPAPKGPAVTVLEQAQGVLDASPNPRRATVIWRTPPGEVWAAAFDGTFKRRVETPAGRVLDAQWSPDGRGILYLLEPADPRELVQIREQDLDSRADALIAKTSQFATFSRNANSSAFVGASRNKASPMVLALLRVTKRELTLCEHRAGDATRVHPIFTPNSQRVIFQTDRHGRPAIYMMNVEKLIERTES